MTKKIKCERCNGTGRIEHPKECSMCKGKGFLWKKYTNHDKPIRQTCSSCNGTGLIKPRCRLCEGYGWYKPKEAKVRIGRKGWY